jgi:hypothetical protein
MEWDKFDVVGFGRLKNLQSVLSQLRQIKAYYSAELHNNNLISSKNNNTYMMGTRLYFQVSVQPDQEVHFLLAMQTEL